MPDLSVAADGHPNLLLTRLLRAALHTAAEKSGIEWFGDRNPGAGFRTRPEGR
jgi:hypothetical protein